MAARSFRDAAATQPHGASTFSAADDGATSRAASACDSALAAMLTLAIISGRINTNAALKIWLEHGAHGAANGPAARQRSSGAPVASSSDATCRAGDTRRRGKRAGKALKAKEARRLLMRDHELAPARHAQHAQQHRQQQRWQRQQQPHQQQRDDIVLDVSAAEAAADAHACQAAAATKLAGLMRGRLARKRARAEESAAPSSSGPTPRTPATPPPASPPPPIAPQSPAPPPQTQPALPEQVPPPASPRTAEWGAATDDDMSDADGKTIATTAVGGIGAYTPPHRRLRTSSRRAGLEAHTPSKGVSKPGYTAGCGTHAASAMRAHLSSLTILSMVAPASAAPSTLSAAATAAAAASIAAAVAVTLAAAGALVYLACTLTHRCRPRSVTASSVPSSAPTACLALLLFLSLCAPTAATLPAAATTASAPPDADIPHLVTSALDDGGACVAPFLERAFNTPPHHQTSSARDCPPPPEGTRDRRQCRRTRAAATIAAHARGCAARRAVDEATHLADAPIPGWWWWDPTCRLIGRGRNDRACDRGASRLAIIAPSPLRIGVEFPYGWRPDHMPTFIAGLHGAATTIARAVRRLLAARQLHRACCCISRMVRGWFVRRGLLPAATLDSAVTAIADRYPIARAGLVLERVIGDASWVYCTRGAGIVIADARAPDAVPIVGPPEHSGKASNARKARARRQAATRSDRDARRQRRQHRWDAAAVRLHSVGSQWFRAGRRAARLPLRRAIHAVLPTDFDSSDGDSDADSRDITANAMERLTRREAQALEPTARRHKSAWRPARNPLPDSSDSGEGCWATRMLHDDVTWEEY